MKSIDKECSYSLKDFIQVIYTSDLDLIKTMVLMHGADVNEIDDSMVPVFAHAVLSQNNQIIDFFIEQGADINPTSPRITMTPLGAACRVAALADSDDNINYTFAKLINLGAHLNPENCLTSPLTEIIKANGPCSEIMATYLVKLGANINPIVDFAFTPLAAATHVGIEHHTINLVYQCIKLGASIDPINPTQTSPLAIALSLSGGQLSIPCAEFLINMGGDINQTHCGQPLITQLIHMGKLPTVESLFEKFGNKISISLEIVKKHISQPVILKLFIKNGYDCSLEASTPLESLVKAAITLNNEESLKLLLENGAKFDLMLMETIANISALQLVIDLKINNYINKISSVLSNAKSVQSEIVSTINELIKNNYHSLLKCFFKQNPNLIIDAIKNIENKVEILDYLKSNGVSYVFKFNNLLLKTVISGYEGGEFNPPEIQEKTKTYFKDGKIYYSSSNQLVENGNDYIYAISKKGELYLSNMKNFNAIHHSFFLKGKEGSKFYGFGKPVACAGQISIEDGKIIKISNGSGHYEPIIDQLKLASYHLNHYHVLADDVDIIFYHNETNHLTISDLQILNIGDILDQYSDLM